MRRKPLRGFVTPPETHHHHLLWQRIDLPYWGWSTVGSVSESARSLFFRGARSIRATIGPLRRFPQPTIVAGDAAWLPETATRDWPPSTLGAVCRGGSHQTSQANAHRTTMHRTMFHVNIDRNEAVPLFNQKLSSDLPELVANRCIGGASAGRGHPRPASNHLGFAL